VGDTNVSRVGEDCDAGVRLIEGEGDTASVGVNVGVLAIEVTDGDKVARDGVGVTVSVIPIVGTV